MQQETLGGLREGETLEELRKRERRREIRLEQNAQRTGAMLDDIWRYAALTDEERAEEDRLWMEENADLVRELYR